MSKGVFTEHIRNFETETAENANRVLTELRKVLQKALVTKRIENPEYLGYTSKTWTEDDKEDLLLKCYSWAILSKLNGLRGQLQRKANIDQIVVGNVWKFLIEEQKKTNPIRYVVFVNCENAIEALAADGALFVEPPQITGYSFIKLVDTKSPESFADDIRKVIENKTEWDEITTVLVARKGESRIAFRQLVVAIPNLANDEILLFQLRTLTDEVSAICRRKSVESQRKQSIEKDSDKNSAGNRILGFDLGYLEGEGGDDSPWLEKLNDLKNKIGPSTKSKKVAARLERIVDLLIEIFEQETDIEKLSWPEIGQRLGIRRQRIYEDVKTLGSIMSDK